MKPTLILFLIIISIVLKAQLKNNDYINNIYNAEYLLEDGKYREALSLYEKLLEIEPDNANINFKVGFCYLQLPPYEKVKAIKHLKKAIENINYYSDGGNLLSNCAPIEAYYYLAYAYHLNYEPEKALAYLDTFEVLIKKYNVEINENILTLRKSCNDLARILNNTQKVEIVNIGNIINSKYDDHSPVISADEKILMFTSKRPDEKGKIKYENIYISTRNKDNSWSSPVLLTWKNFKKKNIATICLSPEGTELYLYVDDSNIFNSDNGNIYVTRNINNEWTTPEPLSINTKYNENHAAISFDGKKLFFSSNRPGGYGKLDIYVTTKDEKGNWSPPVNLGDRINTPEDETGPFISYDNKTLYFSSKGHNTIGGFDLFYSIIDSTGNWTEPINLGYPINTPGDDIFITKTPNEKISYFATDNPDGHGGSDIYFFKFPEKLEKNIAVVSGNITLKDYTIPSNVKISVYDYYSNNLITQYTPYPKSGKYLLVLETGKKYLLVYEGDEFIPQTEIIDLSSTIGFLNLEKTTMLESYKETELTEIILPEDENKSNKNITQQNEFVKSISLKPIENVNIQNNFYLRFNKFSFEINEENYQKLYYISNIIKKDTLKTLRIILADSRKNIYDEIRSNIIKDILFQRINVDIPIIRELDDTINKNYLNIILLKPEEEILFTDKELTLNVLSSIPEKIHFSEKDINIPIIIYPIYFDFDKFICDYNIQNIKNIADILKVNKDAILELTGHTDSIGSYRYNKRLSLKRAQFVKEQLVKLGIDPKRILITGVAFEQPVRSNSTENGRRMNRRVSIKIINCNNSNFRILDEIPESYLIIKS